MPTLDPVDTLLTLAFHAARSDGHRLVWLKDVERAVAVEEPDLDELVRRCRAARCAPPVGLILSRARSLLDAEIPAEIIRAMTPIPLRAADRIASGLRHPVQLHERGTATRIYTRSVRSSTLATLYAVPERGARVMRRFLRPPRGTRATTRTRRPAICTQCRPRCRTIPRVRPQSADGAMDSQDQPTSYLDPKWEPCASTRH